jgi:hypothetical protein
MIGLSTLAAIARGIGSGDWTALLDYLNQGQLAQLQTSGFVNVTYPGSTVAWVNNTNFVVQFIITGGTVTVIALTPGGNTGETTGSWILRPGDSITVTSSVNPTTYGYTPLF